MEERLERERERDETTSSNMCTTLSDGSRISDRKINWHVPPSRHPSRMQILSSLRIRTVENGRWKLDKYRKLKTESSYRLAEIKWQRAAHLDTWLSSEKRQPNRVRLNWISVNTRDFCFSSLPLSLSFSLFSSSSFRSIRTCDRTTSYIRHRSIDFLRVARWRARRVEIRLTFEPGK